MYNISPLSLFAFVHLYYMYKLKGIFVYRPFQETLYLLLKNFLVISRFFLEQHYICMLSFDNLIYQYAPIFFSFINFGICIHIIVHLFYREWVILYLCISFLLESHSQGIVVNHDQNVQPFPQFWSWFYCYFKHSHIMTLVWP